MADYGSPGSTASDFSCGCGGYYPWLAQPLQLMTSMDKTTRGNYSGVDQIVRANINSYTEETCGHGPFTMLGKFCGDQECCMPKDSTENQHYFRFNPYYSFHDVEFKFPSGAWLTPTHSLATRNSGTAKSPHAYAWHVVNNLDFYSTTQRARVWTAFRYDVPYASGDLIRDSNHTHYDCEYDGTNGCDRWYVVDDFISDGETFQQIIDANKIKPLPPINSNYTDPKHLSDTYILFVDWAQPISGTGGGFPPHGNNLLAHGDDIAGNASPEYGFSKILGAIQLNGNEESTLGTSSFRMTFGGLPNIAERTTNQLETYPAGGHVRRAFGRLELWNSPDEFTDGRVEQFSADDYQFHYTQVSWRYNLGNKINVVSDGTITRNKETNELTYSSTMGDSNLVTEGEAKKDVIYADTFVTPNERHSTSDFGGWAWTKTMITHNDTYQVVGDGEEILGGWNASCTDDHGCCMRYNTYGLMTHRTIAQPFSFTPRVPKRTLGIVDYVDVASEFARGNKSQASDFDQVDGKPALYFDPRNLQCARYWVNAEGAPSDDYIHTFTYRTDIVAGFAGRRITGTGAPGMVWGDGFFFQSAGRPDGDWEAISTANNDIFAVLPSEGYSYSPARVSHGDALAPTLHSDTFTHEARVYGYEPPRYHGSLIITYDSGPNNTKSYIDVASFVSVLPTKLEHRYYPTMPDGFGDSTILCYGKNTRTCTQWPGYTTCNGSTSWEGVPCDGPGDSPGSAASFCKCPNGYVPKSYVVWEGTDQEECYMRCETPENSECGPQDCSNPSGPKNWMWPSEAASVAACGNRGGNSYRWTKDLKCYENSSIFNWDCNRNYHAPTINELPWVIANGKRWKGGTPDTRPASVRCAAGFQESATIDGVYHQFWHEVDCSEDNQCISYNMREQGHYSTLGGLSGLIEDYNYRLRLLIDNDLVIDEDLFTYSITGHIPTNEGQHAEYNGSHRYIENVVVNSGEIVDGQIEYGDAKNFRPIPADWQFAQDTNQTQYLTIDGDFNGVNLLGQSQEITLDMFCPAVHVCSMSESYDEQVENPQPLVAAVWWDNVTGVSKNLDNYGLPQHETMPFSRKDYFEGDIPVNCVRWHLRWYHNGEEIESGRSPVSEWANISRYNINLPTSFQSNGMQERGLPLAQPDWRPQIDWSSDRWLYMRNFPLTRASFQQPEVTGKGIRLSEHIATGTAPLFPNMWPNNPATIVNTPDYNVDDKYIIGDRVAYEGRAYVAMANSSYVDVDAWNCEEEYTNTSYYQPNGSVASNGGTTYLSINWDSRPSTLRCTEGFRTTLDGYTIWEEIDCGQDISAYSASSTYSAGAKVKYNNAYYQANQNITTPEAFTLSHWDVYNIDGQCAVKAGPFNPNQWKYIGEDGDFLWKDWMVLHAGHTGNCGKLWIPFGCREENLEQTGNCAFRYNLTSTSCPMVATSDNFKAASNIAGRLKNAWSKDCLATSSVHVPLMPPAGDH